METKIKRGLGIVTNLDLNSPVTKGHNRLSINGAYQEVSLDDDLICAGAEAKIINHSFDEIHFNNCETKVFEIKGNTVIKQDIESPTQLILCIEEDSNLDIELLGKFGSFLSSGIFFHIHKGVNVNIRIKSELNGNQNYLKLFQKQEENSNVNFALQSYLRNQSLIYFKTEMVGENSTLDKRVFMKGNNSNVDSDIGITHKSPRTKSNLVVNGTLEKSKIINENSIFITKDADTCEGYEHSKFILLDDESDAISIPNLEISNNDVSCSHGSTISSVDETELFYLQSRGISRENSINLITEGLESYVLDRVIVKSNQGELNDE